MAPVWGRGGSPGTRVCPCWASPLPSAPPALPAVQAPEILLGKSATPASDVYSFGIVMWEMLTWKLPFGGHNPWTVLNLLMAGKRPTSDPREPLPGPSFAGLPAYEALMQHCWDQAPERRPDFTEVIQRLRELLEHTVQQPAGH